MQSSIRQTRSKEKKGSKRSRGQGGTQEGRGPSKQNRAVTVMFNLINGQGGRTTEVAGSRALEPGSSTPAIPPGGKDSITDTGRETLR